MTGRREEIQKKRKDEQAKKEEKSSLAAKQMYSIVFCGKRKASLKKNKEIRETRKFSNTSDSWQRGGHGYEYTRKQGNNIQSCGEEHLEMITDKIAEIRGRNSTNIYIYIQAKTACESCSKTGPKWSSR